MPCSGIFYMLFIAKNGKNVYDTDIVNKDKE